MPDLQADGYCVLRSVFHPAVIESCREAVWPTLIEYVRSNADEPNRGPNRHFLPMPFRPPCFSPEFVFDPEVLRIVRGAMHDRVVADQWGCDVPVFGSEYQGVHADYRRPLFGEVPDLQLPTYMLVASFGLDDIGMENGPIEIAAGTHRMPWSDALAAVENGRIELRPITMSAGDVLIRHPWALHRGTPNRTKTPRALVSIRYVRRWYADDSREVNAIPLDVWRSLSPSQQLMLRFPIANE